MPHYLPREGSGQRIYKTRETLITDVLAAVDSAKREAAESNALAAMVPSSCPAGLTRSRRYDEDFWGASGNVALGHLRKARGASKPDDAPEDPQLVLDAVWELNKCRALLRSLAAEDLRNRLGSSG